MSDKPTLDQIDAWCDFHDALLALADHYGVDGDTLYEVVGEGCETAILALKKDIPA